MNAIKNKKIAIVGGGPGGLTLARLLQIRGADVTVYERDVNKDVRVQGATLDLHDESGLKALDKAGLMDAFRENYRPGADKTRILDQHAAIIADEHLNEDAENRTFGNERFRPEIDRGPLRKILLESLKPGTIVWDSQFVSLRPDGDGWKLGFKNGTSAVADLVVAADGASSKIRPSLTPIRPFYCGLTVIEASVYNSETAAPHMHKLLAGGKIFAFGDKQSIIVSSKGDGSLVFYAGWKAPQNWLQECGIDFSDKAQVTAWFKKEFSGWSNAWLELFENAGLPFFPRQICSMPTDQSWETLPNLTVLGDAAHLMPPYAGEGVNMAMLDALELSECLCNASGSVQAAIAAYEKQMLERASEAAKMSIDSMEILHSDAAIGFMKQIVQ